MIFFIDDGSADATLFHERTSEIKGILKRSGATSHFIPVVREPKPSEAFAKVQPQQRAPWG
jgi:hypothetical protein